MPGSQQQGGSVGSSYSGNSASKRTATEEVMIDPQKAQQSKRSGEQAQQKRKQNRAEKEEKEKKESKSKGN